LWGFLIDWIDMCSYEDNNDVIFPVMVVLFLPVIFFNRDWKTHFTFISTFIFTISLYQFTHRTIHFWNRHSSPCFCTFIKYTFFYICHFHTPFSLILDYFLCYKIWFLLPSLSSRVHPSRRQFFWIPDYGLFYGTTMPYVIVFSKGGITRKQTVISNDNFMNTNRNGK
jgi:hypothetical protein